jgi:phage tail tape-measure protein
VEVGVREGSAVGSELGKTLGPALGSELGKALGAEVGSLLGTELGTTLGAELGATHDSPISTLALPSSVSSSGCSGKRQRVSTTSAGPVVVADVVKDANVVAVAATVVALLHPAVLGFQ